jgi:uncharacterized protein YciI
MSHATRFIVLTHRKSDGREVRAGDIDELKFMLDAVAAGSIRKIESRGDTHGTVIDVRAHSLQEAQALADALPGVKAGVEKAIVIPLSEYAPFRALADAMI